MRAGWRSPLVVLLCLLALVPFPVRADEVVAGVPPLGAALTSDTWLGGLAAVGCGLMVRATIVTGGTQVGTIAGAVACCGYAVFDLLVVDPH